MATATSMIVLTLSARFLSLSMKWGWMAVSVLVVFLALAGQVSQAQNDCPGVDLVFVIDGSGSIKRENWQTVLRFVSSFVSTFDIGDDATRIGVVYYGNRAHSAFYLDTYNNIDQVVAAINNIPYLDENTNTSGGIREMMYVQFTEEHGDRPGRQNMGIVFTDGASTWDSNLTIPDAQQAQARGIQMFAIGVTEHISVEELAAISSPPHELHKNYFLIDDFDHLLAELAGEIRSAICYEVGGPSTARPATTTTRRTSYPVTDRIVPPGKVPQKVFDLLVAGDCDKDIDLVFALDGTSSMTDEQWQRVREFARDVFRSLLAQGARSVEVGATVFAGYAQERFYLNTYYGTDQTEAGILALTKFAESWSTNLAGALRSVRLEQFTGPRGARTGVQRVTVVVTDGVADRDVEETFPEAMAALASGTSIFSVGVGRSVDGMQIKGISSEPRQQNTNYWLVDNFEQLSGIVYEVANQICAMEPINPACASYTGDVVFVLDSANAGDSDWTSTRDFVARLVDSLRIGDDNVRTGAIVYAGDASDAFFLNTYSNKPDILRAVRDLARFQPNSYTPRTDVALSKMRTQQFRSDRGDRSGYQNVGLVITDQSSNQQGTISEAETARNSGITLYSQGITTSVNTDEIRRISSLPQVQNRNWFYLPSGYSDLVNWVDDVAVSICSANAPAVSDNECGTFLADLVLLVDSTNTNDAEWHAIKLFVLTFIDALPVSANGVRVGIVVYSNGARNDFFLDSYTDRDQLRLRALSLTRYYPNDVSNMTAALNLMRTQQFTVDRGERMNVQNIALVLSNQYSDIVNTMPESQMAKMDGIVIYSVGISSAASEFEVMGISSEPKLLERNYWMVPSFDMLQAYVSRIAESVCAEYIPPIPIPECRDFVGDVVFVVDSYSCGDPGWDILQRFLATLVGTLPISPTQVQVGAIAYAELARNEFYLNQYTSTDDVVLRLLRMQRVLPAESSNTADAIEMMRTQQFTPANGDRAYAPNVGVVIPGSCSVSQDSIEKAQVAQQDGIRLYSIGVTGRADEYTINGISSPDHIEGENYWLIPEYSDMSAYVKQIASKICTSATPRIIPAECKNFTADLTLIIDNTVSRNDWLRVTAFLTSLIDNFFVGQYQVQVGAVVYNTTARTAWFLNAFTFDTRQDLKEALEGLQPGSISSTVNTGEAIYLTQSQLFQTYNGDRLQVPNVALVITDSLSLDDPVSAAVQAREAGAWVFAIGVGNQVADFQIVEMSSKLSSDEFGTTYWLVNSFNELPDMASTVARQICLLVPTEYAQEILSTTGTTTTGGPIPPGPPGYGATGYTGATGPTGPGGPSGPTGQKGQKGSTGSSGPGGPKGDRGSTGPPGPPGSGEGGSGQKGQKGDKGGTGSQGPPGFSITGPPGSTGDRGSTGATGSSGPRGSTGPYGPAGPSGNTGYPGPLGATGATGPRGPPGSGSAGGGMTGATGWTGSTGQKGDRGDSGPTGPYGPAGPSGYPGSDGQKGSKGDAGIPGSAAGGSKGQKGDRGDLGPTGYQGPSGPSGQSGMTGMTGATGADGQTGGTGSTGPRGNQGPGGQPGRDGYPGPQGYPGSDGQKGDRGDPGSGYPGGPGPTGATGPYGPQGNPGQPGGLGRTGATGRTGFQGPPGPVGGTGWTGRPGPTGPGGPPGPPGSGVSSKGQKGEQGGSGSVGPSGRPGSTGWTGSRGITGSTGPYGPQGTSGRPGDKGRTGATGMTGMRGPVGPAGMPGQIGSTGPKGNMGATGSTGGPGGSGPPGPRGNDGYPGPQGPAGQPGQSGGTGSSGSPGATGAPGQRGSDGYPGGTGPNGQRGEKGSSGYTGATGYAGPPGGRGDPGSRGSTGYTGQQGQQGNPGNAGPPGRDGFQGPAGPSGQKGDRGDQGYQGGPGETGPMGPSGPFGVPGTTGSTGATGFAGMPGATGPQGQQGNPGRDGNAGPPGRDGFQGPQGPPGPAGQLGLPGPAGFTGAIGATGQTGNQGSTGPVGQKGQRGDPGMPGGTGSSGRLGATGSRGSTGHTGVTGTAGHTGQAGPTGATGRAGGTGMSGPFGATGWTGREGTPGQRGDPGPLGPQGYKGERGPTGYPGRDGPSGPPGSQGNKGDVGPVGYPGSDGPSGPTGPPGQPGRDGQSGQTGRQGATGSSGATGMGLPGGPGATGSAGQPGRDGSPGRNGVDGQNGSMGPRGPSGPQGPPGQKGEPGGGGSGGNGPPGPPGPPGDSGRDGGPGPMGPRGPQGPEGPIGPRGPPGTGGGGDRTGCPLTNECLQNNGGCQQLCVDTYDSYFCACLDGYAVLNLPFQCGDVTCNPDLADVVFVLDSSSSVRAENDGDGTDNWNLMLQFTADVVDRLNIGRDNVRVGLVEYSNLARGVFNMNHYYDKNELREQILATPYLGGSRNTSGGIRVMHYGQYTDSCGDRVGVDNIAIVVTDGTSNIDHGRTISDALEARADGIKIYTVGVTPKIEEEEVSGISSFPQRINQNYFLTNDFKTLQSLVDHIAQVACTSEGDICRRGKGDLVFVVDSSGSIRDTNPPGYDNWDLMLAFMTEFIDNIRIGPENFRVGVVRYSQDASNIFYLNQYQNAEQIKQAIRDMVYIGSYTNTSGGLRTMTYEQFVPGRGDRDDAQNIGIVLTDGESNIDPDRTIDDAEDARSKGIHIFSVGISDQIDQDELRQIASLPQELNRNYFLSADFFRLRDITETIVEETCSTVGSQDSTYCRLTTEAGLVCFCREAECTNPPLNGTQCANVNECLQNNGGCQQLCHDTEGTYTCSCYSGFIISTDGHTCMNINECAYGSPCGGGYECVDTYGSYFCIDDIYVGSAAALTAGEPLKLEKNGVPTSTATLSVVLASLLSIMLCVTVYLAVRHFRQKRRGGEGPVEGGNREEDNLSISSSMFSGMTMGTSRTQSLASSTSGSLPSSMAASMARTLNSSAPASKNTT